MIRLVVVLLSLALQCLGAAFAGAPADTSSAAPKSPPTEQAAPKAPAKDAAKEAAEARGERIGDWTLFCPEAKDKTKSPSCTLEQLLMDAETKRVAFHLANRLRAARQSHTRGARAAWDRAGQRSGSDVRQPAGTARAFQHLPEHWLSGGADPVEAAARRDLEGGAGADHGLRP